MSRLKYFLKILLSVILAFAIVNTMCLFYYNVPVHFSNDNGFTDYVWEKNKFNASATEGFSVGKTNNEGLSNEQDYTGQEIDILLLGSSQFEGRNVNKNRIVDQLNKKFDDEYFTYNLGVSGHDFLRCYQNLDAALDKYKPIQYVVMEISNLYLSNDEIEMALSNKISELYSVSNPIVVAFEKIPLLRHYYNQVDNLLNKNSSTDDLVTDIPNSSDDITNNLNLLFSQIHNKAEKYNVEFIFIYHTPYFNNDESTQKYIWEKTCEENGIKFIDMTLDFQNEQNNGKYVYGFINTLPNYGHLNKLGHELIAQKIYNYIMGE